MIVGGAAGYRLLRWIAPKGRPDDPRGGQVPEHGRLARTFGAGFVAGVRDRTILDFGCGEGREVVELVRLGARRVIGLDIRPDLLEHATDYARSAGVLDRCEFTTHMPPPADVIVSIDAFEHFSDPGAVLEQMARMIVREGRIWISFGPPWLHPRGGHLFSVFPWAHLLFTETALLRWRTDFKHDGATRFEEVEGGLNQMTVARFVRLVEASPFRFDWFSAVPIRRTELFHNRWSREFLTSVVRSRLVQRDSEPC